MTGDAWSCTCGQHYRVEAVAGLIRFWPRASANRTSVDGYCRQGLPDGARCIRCERVLSLSHSPGRDLAGDLSIAVSEAAAQSDTDAPLARDPANQRFS